jgi:subtilisin family serine protease
VLHTRTCVAFALLTGALVATPSSAGAQEIEGQYIVVLKEQSTGAGADRAQEKVRTRGGRVQREYGRAIKGFSAKLTPTALAEVRADPAVDFVEPDRVISLSDSQTPATWGLDRIDQLARPLNNTYNYSAKGLGVTAYIIDTGLRLTHSQFGGRARSGFDAVDGGSADDCNGHGTHVGGTVGGSTYGVAKQVSLVAVRVLNCSGSGTTSGVIAGINWVTTNHAAGVPAVANMSLGGGVSSALDQAVATSIGDGVTYGVAAGNENANACNSSPSRVPSAITVGSTTSTDARSSFSNFGTCVDVFAPGSGITSSWYTSDTATNTISGTSMATPHVVGAAALILETGPAASPAGVANAIAANASAGVVTGPGTGSPNRLLYTAPSGAPPTTTPTPTPTATPAPCATTPYSDSLAATGRSIYTPGEEGIQSTNGGLHKGCLKGPLGSDFDLYLQKRGTGGAWSTVASGLTSAPNETVTYSGTAGFYRWRVYSYRGAGAYTLEVTRPS